MTRLITMQEILAVKPLSNQAKERYINPLIEDAQLMDLKPLIGSSFLNKIITAPTTYQDLLNGSTYDEGNRSHPGLKRVLIEFTWTRYTFESGDVSTPFGIVNKDYKDGVKIDHEREKELRTQRQQIATEYWYEVKRFIYFDEVLRELYKGTESRNETYKSQTIKRNQWL